MRKLEQILIAVLLLISFSCSKNDDNEGNQNDEISFTITFSDLSQSLKSASLNDSFPTLDDAKQIVLTIKTASGEDTKYTSEKIDIFKMNGTYFSQKLSLVTGSYNLIEFFLIDSVNNTIFAAPLNGSLQAQNVDHPLPIEFAIGKDQITSVNVEVLATTGLSPADFGLVGFIFHEVPTFNFLINLSEKGQMDSLLAAPITITSGTYAYSQTIVAIANNVITLRDEYDDYTISITKEGYLPFEQIFSVDSLKQHSEFPLTVELEKQLPETVTDIDGNVYHTVKIGNQVWMVENLKVTKYNDGSDIPYLTNNSDWGNSTIGAYCWYENDSLNKSPYGALYNWHAVNSDKLCPAGWHIPSDNEWITLATFLGGDNVAGYKMKEAGTSHWLSPNTNADNSSGFTALPGGYRFDDGSNYVNKGIIGIWWSSSLSEDLPITYYINYMDLNLLKNTFHMTSGLSVRCIKD